MANRADKPGFLTLRGGTLRGKKIPVPQDGSVRPTSDRAREQAFNLIDQHFRLPDGRTRWQGARVLDAFAGTGALGAEAVSRGAGPTWLWDIQMRGLKDLATMLKGKSVRAAQQSALHAPISTAPMDLIFLDPPYGKGFIEKVLPALNTQGWIGPETLIYAESELGTDVPAGYDVIADRISSSSLLRLLKPVDQIAS